MPTLIQQGLSALKSNKIVLNLTNIEPIQSTIQFNGGYSFNFVNFLSGGVDVCSKNYSMFYVSPKTLMENNIDIKISPLKPQTLLTRIRFGDSTLNVVPNLSASLDTYEYSYELQFQATPTYYQYFEIEFIDDIYCTISYTDGVSKYYLTLLNNIGVLTRAILIDTQDQYHYFKYVVNKDKIILTKDTSQIIVNGGILSAYPVDTDSPIRYTSFTFNIDNDLDVYLSDKGNNAFIEYQDNTLDINYDKSDFNIASNCLLYRNLDYDTLNNLNVISLKNQMNEIGQPVRGNNLAQELNSQNYSDMREYTSICNDIDKEDDEGLELNYVFYNKTIPISIGKNYFKTEDSLYPFSQININDTRLVEQGAFSYTSPIYSDRISITNKTTDGDDKVYLCTWLSGYPYSDTKVWVDRYYYPDLISKKQALNGNAVYNNTYSSYIETLISTNASLSTTVADKQYFDKKSDLAFKPSTSYIYERFDVGSVNFTTDPTIAQNYYETVNSNGGFVLACELIHQPSQTFTTIRSKRNNIDGGLKISFNDTSIFISYKLYDSVSNSIFEIANNFELLKNVNNDIVVSVDSVHGIFKFFLNGILVINTTFYTLYYNTLLYGDIMIENSSILQPNTFIKDVFLSRAPMTEEDSLILAIKTSSARFTDKLNISLPCGMRNKLDVIDQISSLSTSLMSKSNSVNIYINNLGVTDADIISQIKNTLMIDINEILPVNNSVANINIIS